MDPSGLESIFDDISEEELYNSFVSPPKRCIFTMVDSHGPEGQGKWDEDGRRLLLRSGEGSELFTGVSNPSVMLGIIRSSGCCEVTMIGHRGGISYAGISTQSPSGSIGVFTDSFADHLGNALAANGCSTCSLRIFACQLCNASKEECEYWKVDPNILPAQDQAEQKMWNNVAKRTNCAVTVPTHFLSIGDSSIKRRARKEGHTCVPGGCTISAGTAPDYLEVDEPLIPPKTRTFTPFQLKRTR